MNKPQKSICRVCGKEYRTMNTSDQGWVSMCVNPDCGVRGVVDKIEPPAILDVVITGKIEV